MTSKTTETARAKLAERLAASLGVAEKSALRVYPEAGERLITGPGIGAARRKMRRLGLLHCGHADERGYAYVTVTPLGERVVAILRPATQGEPA